MIDRLSALKLFIAAARTGSFTRAARDARLSQPSASRIVAALEADLGTALFVRSTRALTLTSAGAAYLAQVEPLVDGLDAAAQAARGDGELRGRLRVAMPVSFGSREVVPRLPDFAARHPRLAIELAMSDARDDLVAEGIDLALRLGDLADSALLARRLAVAPRVVVASPAYLARAARPKSPADLAAHAAIIGPANAARGAWDFHRDGRALSVAVGGPIVCAANEGVTACAVAGLGIAAMSRWGCARELADGSLVALLDGWDAGRVPVHALFPAGRGASPAARALADHLAATLASPFTRGPGAATSAA